MPIPTSTKRAKRPQPLKARPVNQNSRVVRNKQVGITANGHTVVLPIKRSYYVKTQFSGETVYEHMFRQILNGEVINKNDIVRRFQPYSPQLGPAAIDYFLKQLIHGIKNSPDPFIRGLVIKRVRHGGPRNGKDWKKRIVQTARHT